MELFKKISCGKLEEERETIKMSCQTYLLLQRLAQEFDEEWMILGEISNGVLQEEFSVPEQKRSSALVEAEKMSEGGNTVIHSHHRLGSFLSSTDTGEGMGSFMYSLVVSRDSKVVGVKKQMLPCGDYWTLAPVKIEITSDDKRFSSIAEEIKKRTITAPAHYSWSIYYPQSIYPDSICPSKIKETVEFDEKIICPNCSTHFVPEELVDDDDWDIDSCGQRRKKK